MEWDLGYAPAALWFDLWLIALLLLARCSAAWLSALLLVALCLPLLLVALCLVPLLVL